MTRPAHNAVIAWSGLPTYGARLLRPVVARYGVKVIASRALFHFDGIEENLGSHVHWIDETRPISWSEIGLQIPDLFIHTGWNIPAFNSLAVEAASCGAWRVPMIDNNWKNSLRQMVGMAVFRVWMRRKFDRVIVPGGAGRRFVQRLGVRPERIHAGMYGADEALFPAGPPGSAREKRCIFVGQFIERKGINELVTAWVASGAAEQGWELRCFGSGPLESLLRGVQGVTCAGFVQAGRLSAELSEARALVLPSREEHWGVVVHEAALSGCALLVSSAAGAASDLVGPENGITFRPRDYAGLQNVFEVLMSQPGDWFDNASVQSGELAEKFGPRKWLEMYESLYADCQRRRASHLASSMPRVA